MGPRTLYLLAGVLWALILTPLAAVAAGGVSAGVAWLYVFGDNPWPAASSPTIVLLALASGLVVPPVVVWIGYELGRRASSSNNLRAERKRAKALVIAPSILILLFGLYVWNEARAFREAMSIASLREAAFADLVSKNQKIDDVTVALKADNKFQARVRMFGERQGLYRLLWEVRDSGFSNVLLSGERSLTLHQGDNEMLVSFTMDQLLHEYRAMILNGRGGVLVDEPFRFEAIQEPVLSPEEQAILPPGEVTRLDSSESLLRSEGSVSFPIRFTIAP